MSLLFTAINLLVLIIIIWYISQQIANMRLELISTQQKCLTYVEQQKNIIMRDNEAQIKNEIFTKINNKIECETPENITFIKKLRLEYEEYKKELQNDIRTHRGNTREIIQKTRSDLEININNVHKFSKEKVQDVVWKIDQTEKKFDKSITIIKTEKVSMKEFEKLCDSLDVSFKEVNSKFDEIITLVNTQTDKKDQKPKKPKYESVVDEEIIREYDDDEVIETDEEEGMIRELEDYDDGEEEPEPEEPEPEEPEPEEPEPEPEEEEPEPEPESEPEPEEPTDFTGENQPFIEDDEQSAYDLGETDEEDFFK